MSAADTSPPPPAPAASATPAPPGAYEPVPDTGAGAETAATEVAGNADTLAANGLEGFAKLTRDGVDSTPSGTGTQVSSPVDAPMTRAELQARRDAALRQHRSGKSLDLSECAQTFLG